MATIVREVIPDGTQWGEMGEILVDWRNLEFGQDFKGASSISFKYAADGAHFSRIRTGMYVIVGVDGNYRWNDSIFYIKERAGSEIASETGGEVDVAGVSLRGKLEDVRWMPAVGSTYSDEGAFKYKAVTPEVLIRAGVTNYKSRATAQFKDEANWITQVITSPPGAWTFLVDEALTAPVSVQEIISKYQELGLISVRFEGFALRVSPLVLNKDLIMSDKTDDVHLMVGVGLTRGEFSESNDDLVTAVLVKGGNDPFKQSEISSSVVQWAFAPQSVIDEWGYHEKVINVESATNPSTLKTIGEVYIANNSKPRYSVTYEMVDGIYDPRSGESIRSPKALVDFQCGDTITILTPNGATTETVYAISISLEGETRQIGLTLRDYFESWDVVFEQRLRRLEQA